MFEVSAAQSRPVGVIRCVDRFASGGGEPQGYTRTAQLPDCKAYLVEAEGGNCTVCTEEIHRAYTALLEPCGFATPSSYENMSVEFVCEFIKLYESEPSLWNVRSNEYRDRNKKEAAYAKLLNKLKEVDPNASRHSVVKKINNLRSAYRKEKKKVDDSLKSGATADSVYKPKLWYFSLFSFLRDPENPRKSHSNMDSEDYYTPDDENISVTYEKVVSSPQTGRGRASGDESMNGSSRRSRSLSPSPNRRTPCRRSWKRRAKETDEENLEKNMLGQGQCKRSRSDEERFDVIAKGFAIKLRSVPRQQMLLAEKLINEILFQAEMGSLTMSHRLRAE